MIANMAKTFIHDRQTEGLDLPRDKWLPTSVPTCLMANTPNDKATTLTDPAIATFGHGENNTNAQIVTQNDTRQRGENPIKPEAGKSSPKVAARTKDL